MLGSQHISEFGLSKPVSSNPRTEQRLALRQQLGSDEIACFSTPAERGGEFAEVPLDLQLKRLSARLRGAQLGTRLALLCLVQPPLERHLQADARYVSGRSVPGAINGGGAQRDVWIPAPIGEFPSGGGGGNL